MNCATKPSRTQLLIWASWLIVFLVASLAPAAVAENWSSSLLGVALQTEKGEPLYPWQRGTRRWKKWAWQRYRA
jgi:hypothetical protein